MLAAALGVCMTASNASATNILANAGFETGALSPWFEGGLGAHWTVDDDDAHSGTYSARDVGNYSINQTFGAVAGTDINEISFWMRHPFHANAPTAYTFSYSDSTSAQFLVFSTSSDWQFFDVTAQLDTAKSLVGFNIFGFSGTTGPIELTRVDDVVIDADVGGVPEPATWALMIAGFGLAGSALRRRVAATA